MKTKTAFSIREMVFTALFTAVMCAIAPVAIPIGPVPITLGLVVVYLAAGTLGPKFGTISVALYVALGAIGLPVFSQYRGGFQMIAGATGGFIIGFILCAFVVGLIIELFRKKIEPRVSKKSLRMVLMYVFYALGMVIGTVLLYTCGTVWFMFVTGNTLTASLGLTVVPFLFGDALKIILACIAAPQLRAAIGRLPR